MDCYFEDKNRSHQVNRNYNFGKGEVGFIITQVYLQITAQSSAEHTW